MKAGGNKEAAGETKMVAGGSSPYHSFLLHIY
jgi:hypothetical protein